MFAPAQRTLLLARALPLRTIQPLTILRLQSTLNSSAATAISSSSRSPSQEVVSKDAEAPLAALPVTSLLRSLLLHSISSSPRALKSGTKVMLANLETMDKNFLLKLAVDKTFYAQFCAGATAAEIAGTIENLRSLGYGGVILAYAREAEITDTSASTELQNIREWLEGSLKTIQYVDPGDYVAVKYSGAGSSCLPLLSQHKKCFNHPELGASLIKICEAAKERGVKLLIDAEQALIQDGVHGWTLELMRRFNTKENAVVYNTYQMYLKSSPEILCRHLEVARREGFTLGVKLVRGAYIGSDPRELIHDTKSDTDQAYDEAIRLMLTGSPKAVPEWSSADSSKSFFDAPVQKILGDEKSKARVDLVIACHNRDSIDMAVALRRTMSAQECGVGRLVFAQLMGMADELSLGLVAQGAKKAQAQNDFDIEVYKYAVWGTTQECVRYLLRRAEENKDAVGRSIENRTAVMKEVWRRIRGG
ncbi:uncharacterized protein H6S33_005375 [Morchella sextelata]|uniref:uncharacterized protein n=1 Tax=Morchella sextelata TaxID=1174677 RepID=UPI001D057F82|nr:uncharacterized protein H6S33_005375 [Morchella sextelata]KAH0613489.1 hypothetical protein H6S33_005375 [Morchella sextelata]